MKKIFTIMLVALLIASSIGPIASAQEAGVNNLQYSKTELIPGETFYVTGTTNPHGVVTFVLQSDTNNKVMMDQVKADANGMFTTNSSLKLPNVLSEDAYNVYINGVLKQRLFVRHYSMSLAVSASSVEVGNAIEVVANVTKQGLPIKNIEVSFVLLESGKEVSEVMQMITDENGQIHFTHKAKVAGDYNIKAVMEKEVAMISFKVNPKSPAPPTPIPTPTPSIPSGNATGGNVAPKQTETVEILSPEGVPLSGALLDVKKSNNGEPIVQIKLDIESFGKTIASKDVIEFKIDAENPKDISLHVPVELLKEIDKNNRTLKLVSDKFEMTIEPNTFEIGDKTLDLAVQISRGNDSNIVSFTVYDEKTLKPVTIKSPIKVKFIFNEAQSSSSKSVVIKKVGSTDKDRKVVPFKVDALATGLTMSFVEQGAYELYTFENNFKDVSDNHWAYENISALAAREIFNGIDATTFADKKKITNSEFVAILVRSLGLENNGKKVNLTDIDGRWYTNEVTVAAQNGIIDSVGKFNPNQPIEREAMAVMMIKALEFKNGTIDVEVEAALAAIKDQDLISDAAKAQIAKAVKVGLIKGIDGSFVPNGQASRAEAAAVIYRLLEQLGDL